MGTHIRTLGVLYIVLNALTLCGAAVVVATAGGVGLIVGEPVAALALGLAGTSVAVYLAAISVPGIIGGIGLLNRRRWARILVVVIGMLHLPNIPLGTLLGLYTLWVLLRQDADLYFA